MHFEKPCTDFSNRLSEYHFLFYFIHTERSLSKQLRELYYSKESMCETGALLKRSEGVENIFLSPWPRSWHLPLPVTD